jgi:hypothetical protein
MAAEQDFLPFATGVGATVLDQVDYAAAAWLATGFQNGIADPAYLNKVWRQSSFVSAAVAAFIQQQTSDAVLDNGSLATFLAQLTIAILQPPLVVVEEQQASTTSAGTFTSGAWQTRLLNTKVTDTGGIATISSNEIELPAGAYLCNASAPAYNVNSHQSRLYNVTGAAILLNGTSEYASGAQTRSFVQGTFTLGAPSTVAFQHRCSVTQAGNGFGAECGFGDVEVYSRVVLTKIG